MDTKQKDLSGTMCGGCGEYRSFPSQKNVICVVESTLTLNRVAKDELVVHCLLHGDPDAGQNTMEDLWYAVL